MSTPHSKKLKRELEFYKSQASYCEEKLKALIQLLGQELCWSDQEKEELSTLLESKLNQPHST